MRATNSEPSTELLLASEHLRAGHVIAVATESWFALAVDPANGAALDLLFALKGRDQKHAVALMAPDVSQWRSLVSEISPLAAALASAHWPGPLTLVLEGAPHLDPRIVDAGAVGVRVPGASAAADLVAHYGGALTATSANLAGEPPCRTSEQVRAAFPAWIEQGLLHVVDGESPGGAPSTLLRVETGRLQVLRRGAIEMATLEASAHAAGFSVQVVV